MEERLVYTLTPKDLLKFQEVIYLHDFTRISRKWELLLEIMRFRILSTYNLMEN